MVHRLAHQLFVDPGGPAVALQHGSLEKYVRQF